MVFSKPTNTPLAANCTDLFASDSCALFGAATQVAVAWSSIDTLEVVLGTGFALRVNDLIRLRGERILGEVRPHSTPITTSCVLSATAALNICTAAASCVLSAIDALNICTAALGCVLSDSVALDIDTAATSCVLSATAALNAGTAAAGCVLSATDALNICTAALGCVC